MRRVTYHQVQGATTAPCTVPVITGRIPRKIPVSLIVWIQACGSCSRIFTRDGRKYTVARNLTTLSDWVNDFWRVHKSHLVNPAYVDGSPGSVRHQGLLRLKTGEQVAVSRRRKEQIYQWLRQLN